MKKGDKLPVAVGGIEVGTATVEYVQDGQVVVLIPAMRSVMGLKTELAVPEPREAETETVVLAPEKGVENTTESEAVEPPEVKEETVESKNDDAE